uniref:Uncharacterized protein n=1 Tax=Opuntia streptacantha TaxID=393608 RepID=A0A7C8Z0P7_OPUST
MLRDMGAAQTMSGEGLNGAADADNFLLGKSCASLEFVTIGLSSKCSSACDRAIELFSGSDPQAIPVVKFSPLEEYIGFIPLLIGVPSGTTSWMSIVSESALSILGAANMAASPFLAMASV